MTASTPPVPPSATSSNTGALLADYYRTGDPAHLVRIVETTPCPPDVIEFLIDTQKPDVDIALLLGAHRDHRVALSSTQTALLRSRVQAYVNRLHDHLNELDARTWQDADSVEEEAAVVMPLAVAQAALIVSKPDVKLTRRPISHAPTSRAVTD